MIPLLQGQPFTCMQKAKAAGRHRVLPQYSTAVFNTRWDGCSSIPGMLVGGGALDVGCWLAKP